MSSLPPEDPPSNPGFGPSSYPSPGSPPSYGQPTSQPPIYQPPVFPPTTDQQPTWGGSWGPPPPVPAATPSGYQPYRPGGLQRFDYGGFGGRLGALFIDGLATGVPPAVVYFVGVIAAPEVEVACSSTSDYVVTGAGGACVGPNPVVVLSAMLIAFVLQLLLAFFVVIRPIGTSGQSIGLKAVGLRVVDASSGQPIGVARSLGRHLFASFLSGCVCYLGYLWMLFNDSKQTWHDMVTSSVVIRA